MSEQRHNVACHWRDRILEKRTHSVKSAYDLGDEIACMQMQLDDMNVMRQTLAVVRRSLAEVMDLPYPETDGLEDGPEREVFKRAELAMAASKVAYFDFIHHVIKLALEEGARAAYDEHGECREPGCVREDSKLLHKVLDAIDK